MCITPHRATPPADLLTLTSADGSTFGAFHARPEHPGPDTDAGRLILLPDMGGLSADYLDLARIFARTGCEVLAIDYFGRTAGPGAHAEDFDHQPHADAAQRENVLADLAAGIAYLDTVTSGPTFTIGSCVGGAHSLLAGTVGPEVLGVELAGVIALYPWTGAYGRSEALPDDFVLGLRVPMLGLFGDADEVVPTALPESWEKLLNEAGLPHEIAVYPGQPHGFFEYHHLGEPGHAEAADDAWERIVAFLGQ